MVGLFLIGFAVIAAFVVAIAVFGGNAAELAWQRAEQMAPLREARIEERDRLKREKLDLNPRKCGDWAKHDDIRKSQTLGYCPTCGERMRKG